MKTALRRFYIAYIAISVLACGICGIVEVQRFAKEKNFSKDLRIPLPEYSVISEEIQDFVDHQTIAEDGDNVSFVVKSFQVKLKEPLSDKAISLLSQEKRGWCDSGQGFYWLRGRKGNDEHIYCVIDKDDDEFCVDYEYGHLYGGYPMYAIITFSILMCLLLIIWSVIELLTRLPLRCVRSKEK